jgi:hypothetical protein
MRLILNLCFSEGFDTFPSLLCTDGCSMIDRRMVGLFHFDLIHIRCISIVVQVHIILGGNGIGRLYVLL